MAGLEATLATFFKPTDPNIKPPKGKVKCVVGGGCKFDAAYRSATLRRHLELAHGEVASVRKYLDKAQRKRSPRPSESPAVNGEGEEMPAHSTLFKNLHSMTRERASRAYEAMARTIVEEDLPFIAFDRPCMRELFTIVNPAFVVPCSRTLVETYIPRVCASVEHAVKEELERARHLTLTVDGWKKDRMHLNAVVVCTPAPIFIGVYRANDREDGPYLYRLLRAVMDGPLLGPRKHKIAAIVTDNGSAIRWAREKLASELGILGMRCAAHGLNLASEDLVRAEGGPLEDLLAEARELAKRLRTTSIMKELNKRNALSPRLDNDTRWNTTHTMMARLLEMRDTVKSLVDDKILVGDIVPRIADNALSWDALERVVAVLDPLAVAGRYPGGPHDPRGPLPRVLARQRQSRARARRSDCSAPLIPWRGGASCAHASRQRPHSEFCSHRRLLPASSLRRRVATSIPAGVGSP